MPARLAVLGALLLTSFLAAPTTAQHRTYRGTGDDVVRIEKPKNGQPALLMIQGNAAGSHFAIVGYSANRQRTGLLVNTTERYEGFVPLDLPPRQNTTHLEVSSEGSWIIQVYPIGAAQKVTVPGNLSGSGDQVLWLDGDPFKARITGNRQGGHFAVIAYDRYGNRQGLLVNTTDPYQGTVMLQPDVLLLEITATHSWAIRLE